MTSKAILDCGMRIPKKMQRDVTRRANKRCEYCQVLHLIVLMMEFDHIIPRSAGGLTLLENLCWSCGWCNRHKGDYQTGIDPETGIEANLFNPRTQRWQDHFLWSEAGTIVVGQTPTGRATIERLQLNHPEFIESRRIWVSSHWHPPQQEDSD